MYPTKKLSEICKFQNWFAFKSELFRESWQPIIRISNIQDNNISYEKLVYFNPGEYKEDLSKYIVKRWDLVIAMSWATTWKIAINQNDDFFYLNQRVGLFRFEDEVTKIYTHYFLGTKIQENLKQSVWSAIPNLSSEQIKNIEIPLPPLSTQSRIVARLDSAFASIDEQISLLRANIADVGNMKKSVLEESFQSGEYEIKTLWEICEFMGSGFACNKKNEVLNGYVHLRTHNIWTDWKLNFDQFVTINPEMVDINRSKIYKWDIIFNNTNSKELVWKTAYVDQDYEYWFSNHLTRLVIKNTFYSKYASIYINYLFGNWFFQNLANKWIWQAWVNNTMLKAINIPLPPLPRQHEIVRHLDRVFTETTLLRGEYEAQIQDLQTLKQSLLEEAFAGRLVQEIEA